MARMGLQPSPPPGPSGPAAFMGYLAMRRSRLAFIADMRARYGPVARLEIGGRRLLIVSSQAAAREVLLSPPEVYAKGSGVVDAAELFGEGLLTARGESWRGQRHAIAAQLRRVPMGDVIATIEARLDQLAVAWGPEPAVRDLMAAVTWAVGGVVSVHVMGVDVDVAALRRRLEVVERRAMARAVAIAPNFSRAGKAARAALHQLRHEADSVFAALAARARPSLFSRLFADGCFTKELLTDEIATFFLASQDNVIATLLWTLSLMSGRPDLQAAIRTEVTQAGAADRAPVSALMSLHWTRATIAEAMRLYPPVWAITRRAMLDTSILGYAVKAGDDVIVSPYLINHDESVWPQADQFRPERFIDEDGAFCGGEQVLPFGIGPRRCVAIDLATTESIAIVAGLARRFRFSGLDTVEPFAGFSLHPDRSTRCLVSPVPAPTTNGRSAKASRADLGSAGGCGAAV